MSLPYKAIHVKICSEYRFIFRQIKLISHNERLCRETRFETEAQDIFTLSSATVVQSLISFSSPLLGGVEPGLSGAWAQPLYRAWNGELKNCPSINAEQVA